MLTIDTITLTNNIQDRTLETLLTQLNGNIIRFNKIKPIQKTTKKDTLEQEYRQRLYIILAERMYWNTLLESERIDQSKPNDEVKVRCQQRKASYEHALIQNTSTIRQVLPAPTENNYENWDFLHLLSDEKKEKHKNFENRLEQIKKSEETNVLSSAAIINQQLSALFVIIAFCNKVIFHLTDYKRKNQEIINLIKNKRSECVRRCIEYANLLVQYLERLHHTDELYILLADMQKQYPHAAIEAKGNPANFLPSEQMQVTYRNLNRVIHLRPLATRDGKKDLQTINGKFLTVAQLNNSTENLLGNKPTVKVKDKMVARLMTNPSIATSIYQSQQLIIHINIGSVHNPSIQQNALNASHYCSALIANNQAFRSYQAIVDDLGWTFTFVGWLFSTKRYKAHQAIETTLTQQKRQLEQVGKYDFKASVTEEIKSIFASSTNLLEITQQLQAIFSKLNYSGDSVEVKGQIANIRNLYQQQINFHMIQFIRNHLFNDLRNQIKTSELRLLNLKNVLSREDINHLLDLIICLDNQFVPGKTKSSVKEYLSFYNCPDITEIQTTLAKNYLEKYSKNAQDLNVSITARVFDKKYLPFIYAHCKSGCSDIYGEKFQCATKAPFC